jgi:hypothetical protein
MMAERPNSVRENVRLPINRTEPNMFGLYRVFGVRGIRNPRGCSVGCSLMVSAVQVVADGIETFQHIAARNDRRPVRQGLAIGELRERANGGQPGAQAGPGQRAAGHEQRVDLAGRKPGARSSDPSGDLGLPLTIEGRPGIRDRH